MMFILTLCDIFAVKDMSFIQAGTLQRDHKPSGGIFDIKISQVDWG